MAHPVPMDETVFVIDDEPEVRDSLARLLRSAGLPVEVFASAAEFIGSAPAERHGCVLLDVDMPDMTGPELHDRLRQQGIALPVIYLTGRSNIAISVRAMKQGAHDFLEKPVDADELLAAIAQAMDLHRQDVVHRQHLDQIRQRLEQLSPREREVMAHVVRGRLNKQIAGDLGIAEKTVKVHRARVMAKMGVRSVAQLVHRCDLVQA